MIIFNKKCFLMSNLILKRGRINQTVNFIEVIIADSALFILNEKMFLSGEVMS